MMRWIQVMSGASKLMRSGGVGENLEFGWNDEM